MKRILLTGTLFLTMINLFAQFADSIYWKYNIDEVEVMTTRSNTQLKSIPQRVELIDNTVIAALPADNITDVLKASTNIDLVQYPGLSSSIGMRGFSPSAHTRNYTLLLIDGIPMGSTNLSTLDKNFIERVEIVKGPYSVLYGSGAMGGVINIITKQAADKNGGSASISAGSFGNLKLSGYVNGVLNDKSKLQLGFVRNQQTMDYRIGTGNLLKNTRKRDFILDRSSQGDKMTNSKWQYNQANAKYTYTVNKKLSTGFETIYFNANDVSVPGNYWGTYGQTKKDIDRINLIGNISYKTEKNLFSFKPYYSNEKEFNYTPYPDTIYSAFADDLIFISFKSNISEYGAKLSNTYTMGDLKILAGADLDYYDYKTERFSDKATPTSPYKPDNKNAKVGAFSQLSYSGYGFDVNAGLRFNYIEYNIQRNEDLDGSGGNQIHMGFNPSFGIQYTTPFYLKAHYSLGTGFLVPDAFHTAGFYSVSEYFAAWDFWWVQTYKGNPELLPETSVTHDLGISYELPSKLFLIDITGFKTFHNNRIVEYYVNNSDTLSYKNVDGSVMLGAELIVSTNLGALFNNNFKLEIYGNLSHLFKSTLDETMTSISGADSIVTRDLLYVRKNNGSFGIAYDNLNGFSARINARYIGKRLENDRFYGGTLRPEVSEAIYYNTGGYTVDDRILDHPEFLVFDVSFGYTIDKYRFGLSISNLLNENYTEKDGYNMTGRAITASLNYTF